jgi:hypothetical protein
MTQIFEARTKIIEAGGRPDALKISKQAIEKYKVFGLEIEVVESNWLPEGVEFMVIEEKDIL